MTQHLAALMYKGKPVVADGHTVGTIWIVPKYIDSAIPPEAPMPTRFGTVVFYHSLFPRHHAKIVL